MASIKMRCGEIVVVGEIRGTEGRGRFVSEGSESNPRTPESGTINQTERVQDKRPLEVEILESVMRFIRTIAG